MKPLRLESVDGSPVVEYRLTERGIIERRALLASGRPGRDGAPWEVASMQALRKQPAEGPVWTWLREHGIRRPSPSGPSGRSQSAEDRRAAGRVRLDAWISQEASARLDELAGEWSLTRREAIERAIMRGHRS